MDIYKVSCYAKNGHCYVTYNGCTSQRVQELKKKFEEIGDKITIEKTC